MKFSISQLSRQGGRRNNQDRMAYCYSKDALLMVVADGLGGHGHGEIAAQVAVQFLTDAFRKQSIPRLGDPLRFLHDSLYCAHTAIDAYSAKHALESVPRTTCVACVVQNNAAYWGHAGDSRLYLFRNGKLFARTKDHSLVQTLVDSGELDESRAGDHPERNRIYSCLGGPVPPQVTLSGKITLHQGDILLMSTDGLWSTVATQEMAAVLDVYPIDEAVTELLDFAELRGGADGDNLTAIGMAWGRQDKPSRAKPVSTGDAAPDGFTTLIGGFGKSGPIEYSEEDMEKAIADIQTALKTYRNKWGEGRAPAKGKKAE
ncbi:MAG: PP2C family protein-serine/threonine phosphatase [Burkholderiales bacterium]